MQSGQPLPIRFPLLAVGLQVGIWLAVMGLYGATYLSDVLNPMLSDLELRLTYGLLLISGIGGGGLALIGIYRLLAYSSRGIGRLLFLILSGLSLLWAEICLYALLIFLAAI